MSRGRTMTVCGCSNLSANVKSGSRASFRIARVGVEAPLTTTPHGWTSEKNTHGWDVGERSVAPVAHSAKCGLSTCQRTGTGHFETFNDWNSRPESRYLERDDKGRGGHHRIGLAGQTGEGEPGQRPTPPVTPCQRSFPVQATATAN